MQRPLRVIVADDEKMARKRVLRLLEALGPVDLVAECRSGDEVLRHLDPARVDVALLDIDMPGANGLEVAELARLRGVPVIFLTAHEQHAVAAFDHGALHYLLKPVDATQLARALDRLPARSPADEAESTSATRATSPAAPLERVALTVRGDVVLLAPHAITHALYDGELVTVHTAERAYITDESLQDLEARIASPLVLRVQRRAILNLARVQRLRGQTSGGYVAVLDTGAEVPVSRQAARDLRKRLGI
ncbi:MAG: response regulator transcription factor [Sandaracinaceae bacterium]|nr:response regulator transcription factor [Sandaracinaceae bacterium]